MKNFARNLLAAMALSSAALASPANATTFTVQAIDPMGSWLDTGINLQSSTTYNFSVINPATLWSAGSNVPFSRSSTADGISPLAGYGTYTANGFTANYGALVGEAGSTLFLIGTADSESGLSGDLKVGYWDSYYGDNSGSQTLSVSAVPEPLTLSLFGVGLAGATAVRRRKRAKEA